MSRLQIENEGGCSFLLLLANLQLGGAAPTDFADRGSLLLLLHHPRKHHREKSAMPVVVDLDLVIDPHDGVEFRL